MNEALKDGVGKEAKDKAVEQEVLKEERHLRDAHKKRKSTAEAYKAERILKQPENFDCTWSKSLLDGLSALKYSPSFIILCKLFWIRNVCIIME